MARKRQIDPDFWTSEQVISLPVEARLLFIGMISHADDEGRLKGSVLSLRINIFPTDNFSNEQIEQWRDKITEGGLAKYYKVDGMEYLWLPTFQKYQYMTKSYPSKLPPPNGIGNDIDNVNGIGNGRVYNKLTTKEQPVINQLITKEVLQEEFNAFWDAYPKKKSKGQAEKAFTKIKPDEQLLAIMLSAIKKAKSTLGWQKDGGKFIPYPATWLNAKGWEDEFLEREISGGEAGGNPKESGVKKLKASIGKRLD